MLMMPLHLHVNQKSDYDDDDDNDFLSILCITKVNTVAQFLEKK